MKSDTVNFQTQARLILEIGRESIESKIIALSELVKNSYDAKAHKCTIKMIDNGEKTNLFDNEINEIHILDDGEGMCKQDLLDKWLVIGTNNKLKEKEKLRNEFRGNISEQNDYRFPIGEKGIGRFAVNKIGNKLEIVTKKQNEVCYRLFIDFTLFESDKSLDSVSLQIDEYEDYQEFFPKGRGTLLRITDLRENWNEDEIQKVYDEILKFQSPFPMKDVFEINFDIPNSQILEHCLRVDDIFELSLWNCSINVCPNEESGNMYFQFTPYKQMDKMKRESKEIPIRYFSHGKRLRKIDISKYNIGNIVIRLYAFHRSTNVLKMLHAKRNELKLYLDNNGGVRVYRDNQRIYDYGSKDEDWLGLNLKRLNSPGTKLSKNILIGIVEITAKDSGDLQEKTNREGFIENPAFEEFKSIVSLIVDEFANALRPTKEKIKQLYDKTIKNEQISDIFDELNEEIENSVLIDENEKNKLSALVDKVSEHYNRSKHLLLSVVNTSVDFHMVFHDVEKQMRELIKLVNKDNVNISEVRKTIANINEVLKLQEDLIKSRNFKNNSIEDIINKFQQYAKYRLKDHKVEMILEIDKSIVFKCIESQIIRILINLLDNSLYWLDMINEERKIFLRIHENRREVVFVFCDNGLGLQSDNPAELFQPFVSKKSEGIGLGLYIVKEIVELHKGYIKVLDETSKDIPLEFKKGAGFLICINKQEI